MLGSKLSKTDLISILVTTHVLLVLAVPQQLLSGFPQGCPWPRSPSQTSGMSAPAPGTAQQGQSPAPLPCPAHHRPCRARPMCCVASAHPCGPVWPFWGCVWPCSPCWAWPWPPCAVWCPAWPQPIPGPMEVPDALSSACPCPAIEFRVTSLVQI